MCANNQSRTQANDSVCNFERHSRHLQLSCSKALLDKSLNRLSAYRARATEASAVGANGDVTTWVKASQRFALRKTHRAFVLFTLRCLKLLNLSPKLPNLPCQVTSNEMETRAIVS